MAFEQGLRSRLLADVAVAQLVEKRVDWNVRPQLTGLPAVVLETINSDRPQTHDGFDAFKDTLVQVNCFAKTKAEAVELREAVIEACVPADTAEGTEFLRAQDITVRGQAVDTDPEPLAREIIDIRFWHN